MSLPVRRQTTHRILRLSLLLVAAPLVARAQTNVARDTMGLRPAFACADRVVYYSRRTQAHFAHLSRGKDAFVWNGCDAELFHPVAHEEAAALRTRARRERGTWFM